MTDLHNPRLIYLKGGLFLLGGCLAGGLLLAEVASWRVAFLLAVTVWCFCRAYYFAFYVIQHYVDPGYRFAGIGSFLRYLWRAGSVSDRSLSSYSDRNDQSPVADAPGSP